MMNFCAYICVCVCMYVGANIYLDMGRGQKTTTILFLWCLVFLLFVLFLKQAESLAWKFAKQTTLIGQQAPGINLLLPTQCLNSTSMPPEGFCMDLRIKLRSYLHSKHFTNQAIPLDLFVLRLVSSSSNWPRICYLVENDLENLEFLSQQWWARL